MRASFRLAAAVAALGVAGELAVHRVLSEGAPPAPPDRIPPLEAPYALPPLPDRSPRNASYTIEARLDPAARTITGSLVLEWRNTSDVPLSTFPFHLYWNAFRNTASTSARGLGRRAAVVGRGPDAERRFGWIHVSSVRLLPAAGEGADGALVDLTPSLRFAAPDDGNADDRTVVEVDTPSPLAPGETARFRVDWTSRVPYGDLGRAGWVHDYHFVAQWFPKIGVHVRGAWNAHQFHPWTEFFADYGVYDVRLTVPDGFVVGATGRLTADTRNGDGTRTFRFVQEDVHDFAWTASRRFLERTARFEEAGYPPVDIRLLLMPEHEAHAERYLDAVRLALRAYGSWSAPYPYPQLTVVDPAWTSGSGGMEYPTLITGGTHVRAPRELQSPESVTVHEAGHQFWYGLVATNEFEEAWLDEGVNRYHDRKALFLAYGPRAFGRRYFGFRASPSDAGWPVLAPVWVGPLQEVPSQLRKHGATDDMARPGWAYRTSDSYGLNSYGKPALALQTLERLVGDETMTRILRTYARRFRFAHPTSADFVAVVNEVTGRDFTPFFAQTWYGSGAVDFGVVVRREPAAPLRGFVDGSSGPPVPAPSAAPAREDGPWDSEVTIVRHGEVRLPVELRVELADGRVLMESWDGQDRWRRFRYPGAKVVRATVDPFQRLTLDVDPKNNAWVEERGYARRAATRWAARFAFWLQHLLELHTVLG